MNNKNQLLTKWGEQLDKNCPLAEYPRPQLVRDNWRCFNGEWDYAITNSKDYPEQWDGSIIVPFSPESILSGVNKKVKTDQYLWYRRFVNFTLPKDGNRVLLHFGAVDQVCHVFLNGKFLGKHAGGYWPFHFDITDNLRDGTNTISVCVRDKSNLGDEAYGKQSVDPGKIWYTGQTGIWQTVWSEEVPLNHIERIKITPNIRKDYVIVELFPSIEDYVFDGEIEVVTDSKTISVTKIFNNKVTIPMVEYELWSPKHPFLYDLIIHTEDDSVTSYFGMREFDKKITSYGHVVPTLNGEPIFFNGLLDQGYWSDGLYTAASDAAMIWDIQQAKELGYNTLRKHIKIEPQRWYYHCDRLGMIVWQDFVSGGGPYKPWITQVAPWIGMNFKDDNYKAFGRESKKGRENFERDMYRTIDLLYNSPAIAVWVPFNEAWGQFDAVRLSSEVHRIDDTRLIDHASGYHDQGVGDFQSYHVYYKPFKPKKDKNHRILALSEFGGYSMPIIDHMYSNKEFGYKLFNNNISLTKAILELYQRDIFKNMNKGLSALIYTQLSDVQEEINGLMTYDRKELKIDKDILKDLNTRVYEEFNKNTNQ